MAAEIVEGIEGAGFDWVTFTSASTAKNLWELLSVEQRAKVAGMKRVSIGPVTSAALAGLGSGEWKATIEAGRHDIAGVVEAICAVGGRVKSPAGRQSFEGDRLVAGGHLPLSHRVHRDAQRMKEINLFFSVRLCELCDSVVCNRSHTRRYPAQFCAS